MPVAKLRASGTSDAIKSEEGNDYVDTFIRQAIGKDPFLSFPRTGDNPVQWIQLLHALDQQDLPGWPLLSPLKVQMLKCEKCSREFCSPINYRRHIRVHRRSLNVDKESHKNRDLLGAFWDKLSLDEAREVVSFNDVTLEDVPGASLIRALTSFIRKPGFCILPQVYVRAGSALLDVIQARPSRIPISSQELFSILDDASEGTFLCAGTAESMQKYVFDGEAGKIGLEMKNLVACTSFLVEQKLVKAWLADKDAEALRCQKLLVEEEEAAQKRQADLLERKRKKKLRQKEQKAKEQEHGGNTSLIDVTGDILESLPAETSSVLVASESCSNVQGTPTDLASSLEFAQPLINEGNVGIEAQFGFSSKHFDSSTSSNLEHRTAQGIARRHLAVSRWQVQKSRRGIRNGFRVTRSTQALKLDHVQGHVGFRDPRTTQSDNGVKVWTRKPKPEIDEEGLKFGLQKKVVNQRDKINKFEVIIGSIPVNLGNGTFQQQGDILVETQGNYCTEHAVLKNSMQEKPIKTDFVQGGSNRSTVKLWRPVSRHETKGPVPVQSGGGVDAIVGKNNDLKVPIESCLTGALDGNGNDCTNNSHILMDESTQLEDTPFSDHAAKAFLAQRWKEAIAADHVKLVLTPESEPRGCSELENKCSIVAPFSDSSRRSSLSNREHLVNLKESSTTTVKAVFRTKLEKGLKIKYIPKQRTLT